MISHKDRIIATLRGEATDRLPFIPRLDLWYKANKKNKTLPKEYSNASLIEIVDDLDLGYHCIVPDFLDFTDPLDEIDRALGLYRLRTMAYRPVLRGIKRNIIYDSDTTTVQYFTPYGNIQTKVLYDEKMKKAGITITHILEHAIKSIDDFEAVAYIFENIEVQPTYEQYFIAQEEVGDRGVAVAFTTLAGSPMHLIQRELMPYMQFFNVYAEHNRELKWLAEKISSFFNKVIEVVSKSPAEIVFVGEAPGYDEDQQGKPFVGRAGKLLTRIIESISLTREDVYICNVIKCRPPKNRNPEKDEIEACEPFLTQQIEIISPKVICALGKFAVQFLLQTDQAISKLRGNVYEYHGIPVIPTFHPAYLLRNPGQQEVVDKDVNRLKEFL